MWIVLLFAPELASAFSFLIFQWCNLHLLFEFADKIAGGGKAGLVCNLGDTFIRGIQHKEGLG